MTDIVERLRHDLSEYMKTCSQGKVIEVYEQDRHDAADEIERLRVEIDKLHLRYGNVAAKEIAEKRGLGRKVAIKRP